MIVQHFFSAKFEPNFFAKIVKVFYESEFKLNYSFYTAKILTKFLTFQAFEENVVFGDFREKIQKNSQGGKAVTFVT
jgi:hypothetical protein